jgi:predicted small lipoprotein YifL
MAHLGILVGLTAFVAGCGQKGPLVLPDTPKHKKVAPATPTGAPTPPPAATPATSPAVSPAATLAPAAGTSAPNR